MKKIVLIWAIIVIFLGMNLSYSDNNYISLDDLSINPELSLEIDTVKISFLSNVFINNSLEKSYVQQKLLLSNSDYNNDFFFKTNFITSSQDMYDWHTSIYDDSLNYIFITQSIEPQLCDISINKNDDNDIVSIITSKDDFQAMMSLNNEDDFYTTRLLSLKDFKDDFLDSSFYRGNVYGTWLLNVFNNFLDGVKNTFQVVFNGLKSLFNNDSDSNSDKIESSKEFLLTFDSLSKEERSIFLTQTAIYLYTIGAIDDLADYERLFQDIVKDVEIGIVKDNSYVVYNPENPFTFLISGPLNYTYSDINNSIYASCYSKNSKITLIDTGFGSMIDCNLTINDNFTISGNFTFSDIFTPDANYLGNGTLFLNVHELSDSKTLGDFDILNKNLTIENIYDLKSIEYNLKKYIFPAYLFKIEINGLYFIYDGTRIFYDDKGNDLDSSLLTISNNIISHIDISYLEHQLNNECFYSDDISNCEIHYPLVISSELSNFKFIPDSLSNYFSENSDLFEDHSVDIIIPILFTNNNDNNNADYFKEIVFTVSKTGISVSEPQKTSPLLELQYINLYQSRISPNSATLVNLGLNELMIPILPKVFDLELDSCYGGIYYRLNNLIDVSKMYLNNYCQEDMLSKYSFGESMELLDDLMYLLNFQDVLHPLFYYSLAEKLDSTVKSEFIDVLDSNLPQFYLEDYLSSRRYTLYMDRLVFSKNCVYNYVDCGNTESGWFNSFLNFGRSISVGSIFRDIDDYFLIKKQKNLGFVKGNINSLSSSDLKLTTNDYFNYRIDYFDNISSINFTTLDVSSDILDDDNYKLDDNKPVIYLDYFEGHHLGLPTIETLFLESVSISSVNDDLLSKEPYSKYFSGKNPDDFLIFEYPLYVLNGLSDVGDKEGAKLYNELNSYMKESNNKNMFKSTFYHEFYTCVNKYVNENDNLFDVESCCEWILDSEKETECRNNIFSHVGYMKGLDGAEKSDFLSSYLNNLTGSTYLSDLGTTLYFDKLFLTKLKELSKWIPDKEIIFLFDIVNLNDALVVVENLNSDNVVPNVYDDEDSELSFLFDTSTDDGLVFIESKNKNTVLDSIIDDQLVSYSEQSNFLSYFATGYKQYLDTFIVNDPVIQLVDCFNHDNLNSKISCFESLILPLDSNNPSVDIKEDVHELDYLISGLSPFLKGVGHSSDSDGYIHHLYSEYGYNSIGLKTDKILSPENLRYNPFLNPKVLFYSFSDSINPITMITYGVGSGLINLGLSSFHATSATYSAVSGVLAKVLNFGKSTGPLGNWGYRFVLEELVIEEGMNYIGSQIGDGFTFLGIGLGDYFEMTAMALTNSAGGFGPDLNLNQHFKDLFHSKKYLDSNVLNSKIKDPIFINNPDNLIAIKLLASQNLDILQTEAELTKAKIELDRKTLSELKSFINENPEILLTHTEKLKLNSKVGFQKFIVGTKGLFSKTNLKKLFGLSDSEIKTVTDSQAKIFQFQEVLQLKKRPAYIDTTIFSKMRVFFKFSDIERKIKRIHQITSKNLNSKFADDPKYGRSFLYDLSKTKAYKDKLKVERDFSLEYAKHWLYKNPNNLDYFNQVLDYMLSKDIPSDCYKFFVDLNSLEIKNKDDLKYVKQIIDRIYTYEQYDFVIINPGINLLAWNYFKDSNDNIIYEDLIKYMDVVTEFLNYDFSEYDHLGEISKTAYAKSISLESAHVVNYYLSEYLRNIIPNSYNKEIKYNSNEMNDFLDFLSSIKNMKLRNIIITSLKNNWGKKELKEKLVVEGFSDEVKQIIDNNFVKDAQFNIFTVSDVQSDPAEIETSSVFSKLIEFFKPKRRSGAIGYSVGKTSLVDANGKISSTDSQVDVYLDGGHMTHIKDRHIILDATFPNNKEGKSTMWPPRDKIIGPSGEHFTDSVSGIFEWIKYALKSGSARYDKNTNLNIQNAPIRVEVVVENAIVSDGPWTAPKGYESYYDKGSLNQPTNGVKVVLEYNRNDKSWNIVSAYPITGPTKIK